MVKLKEYSAYWNGEAEVYDKEKTFRVVSIDLATNSAIVVAYIDKNTKQILSANAYHIKQDNKQSYDDLYMAINYCERTLKLTKDSPMLKYYIDQRDKVINKLNNITPIW